MKMNKILEAAARTFAGVKLGGKKSDPKLAALDRSVLTVGLQLAALDGTILPEEFAAFQTLATKCRGGSAKNVRTLLDAALPSVGYLMAMAQVGVYDDGERLTAFLDAAQGALPMGFADGSMADVRRAFALWVSVGVADGEFSPLERKAIESLADLYADVRCLRENALLSCVGTGFMASNECVANIRPAEKVVLIEAEFLAKAERIARDFATPSKQAKAESDLEALISKGI